VDDHGTEAGNGRGYEVRLYGILQCASASAASVCRGRWIGLLHTGYVIGTMDDFCDSGLDRS